MYHIINLLKIEADGIEGSKTSGNIKKSASGGDAL